MSRAAALLLLLTSFAEAQVQITYLANEGVMIQSGTTKVLVDALFRDSLGDYLRHTPDTQERMETGKPPFDNVVLTLATHFHLDHWDAGAITRFLTNNPSALFASTPTATAMLPRSQQSRVRAPYPGSFEHAGIHIESIPLQHGSTENTAFLVKQGNRTWIHLGDSDPSPANLDRLRKYTRPDIAMVPFWWLLDEQGRAFLESTWKSSHIVALHFGAADITALRNPIPGAWYCTEPGKSRNF